MHFLPVLEYDWLIRDLKTVSMHIFEDDDVSDGMIQNAVPPRVFIDPHRR